MYSGPVKSRSRSGCAQARPAWRQSERQQGCKAGRNVLCKAAGTNMQEAATDFVKQQLAENEDKVEEGPLFLDYMSQMEHDTKFEDSPFSEAGEAFGEYTPFSFITYAEDPENFCAHEFSRLINAPVQEVSAFFEEWNNLPPAFDLIDTIIEDGADPDAAQLMLFYRWRRTPPLQILLTLHRERSADGSMLAFSSDDGMPFAAMLRLEAAPEARGGGSATVATLAIEYALPNVLVEYVGRTGIEMHVNSILRQNFEVCQKLIEGNLTLDTLGEWYEQHRADKWDGNVESELAAEFANIPDHVHLDLKVYQDEQGKQQHETFVHNTQVMRELVDEGKYVETKEGWVRSDLDDDEVAAADEVARYYRYFHDQRENADQEQLANAEEMLRYMTYGAGWQGLDGPPDAESRPFEFWDGTGPHWRGDARRGEAAAPPPPQRAEAAAAAQPPAAAPLEADAAAGADEQLVGDVASDAEGSGGEEIPEVEGVVDEVAEGQTAEGRVKRKEPETLEDIEAMTKEEALNSVQAVEAEDDFSDDVRYPPVAMERLGVDLAPGQGPRNGLVEEPWRQVLDVALGDDQPGPEDPEEVREQGTQLAEALRRMRVAREAAELAGEELTAEAVGEEEEEEEQVEAREALREEFAASVEGNINTVPWTTPYDDQLEDAMAEEYEAVAVVDEDDNVLGSMPVVSREDAARMGPAEVHDYMTRLADAAGMKEEFQQMLDDAVPKEEVQQDVLEQVTGAMQWQREAAAEAGLTIGEFHDLNTAYQEASLGEVVQELADKMGVDAGRVMSSALLFTDRTRADAERAGLTHDEYLGAICETMDDLNTEEEAAAAQRGLDVNTYRDMAASIEAGAPQKAAALDMTVEEYEAYAWGVLAEAQRRGLSMEDRVEGVDAAELEAGLKEIEELRASGGPWAMPEEPAPWEKEEAGGADGSRKSED
eukprot:jgi/Ulvmu1/6685/UM030_0016.1